MNGILFIFEGKFKIMKTFKIILIGILFYGNSFFTQNNFSTTVSIPLEKLGVSKEILLQEAIKNGAKTENDISMYIERRIYELELQYKIKNGLLDPNNLVKIQKGNYDPYANNISSKEIGGYQIQSAYCSNASFELGNFNNWGASVGNSNTCGGSGANSPVYTLVSNGVNSPQGNNAALNSTNYHTLMNIPPTNPNGPNGYFQGGYDSIATLNIGGNHVSQIPFKCPFFNDPYSVRLNGYNQASYRACRMTYTFNITPGNKNIQFAFAVILNNPGHANNEQPYFRVRVLDQNMNPLGGICGNYDINATQAASDTSFKISSRSSWYLFRPWRLYSVDLTSPIYSTVTTVYLEFTVGGCCWGGHEAYAYVDAECSSGGATSSMCMGTNSAILTAPAGFVAYQWYTPSGTPVPASQGGNTPTITVNPAITGQVYQVQMVTGSGCTVTLNDTIKISNVQITAIGSNPSCVNGSSGSTWVNVTGSNTGYNFTWANSSGATVSTTNTAVNLPPGVYSVTVTAVSCGFATATVQVGTKPPTFSTQTVYYCNGNPFAVINAPPGGTGYQWWWSNFLPATAFNGQSSMTVTPPSNGMNIYMSYITAQGCKDSVKYTLQSTNPIGNIQMSSVASICPSSGNVGYATVNLQTPNTGPFSYSVTGASYNHTLTSYSKKDSLTGLAIGTYTATVFDGSCFYTTTFTISPYNWSFTVTPTTATLCNTGTVNLAVNFGTMAPTSCGPASGMCTSPNIIQVGNGNNQNSSTTWPSVYGNWYRNARHQLLFTAAELLAAGVQPGKLSSIAFFVSSIPSGYIGTLPAFTIKIKCTSATQLTSSFDNNGLTTVWGPSNYTPVNGWNTHNFTVNYDWDGTSNILVDICYNMVGYTSNPIMPSTNTGVVRCVYYYSDSNPACGQASGTTSTNRPNVRFGNCAGANPSQFTYNWTPSTFLSSTNTQSTMCIPTVTASTTMIYTVTVNPINQVNCAQSQAATVQIYVPATPTISAPNVVCDNFAPLQLTVSPNTGTWTTTSYLNNSGVFTPSLASIGNNTVMYTVGSGTCSASSTKTISVEQYHPATLTGTISPLCLPNPTVDLQALVADNNGLWSGNGVNGWIFNPSAAGAGTYTLTYFNHSVPTVSLCPDTSYLVVSIDSLPTPSFVPMGPFCNTFPPQQVTVTPMGGTFGTSNALTANGVFYPNAANIGINVITYTIFASNGACQKTATTNISVEQFVPATLTGTAGPFCYNAQSFNLNSIAQYPGGTWAGAGVNGGIFNPSLSGPGVFTLQYSTHSTPTATLCPDASTISVKVSPQPTINIVANPLRACTPAEFNLSVNSVSVGTITWLVQELPPYQGFSYNPILTNPGTYSVGVGYIDDVGCTAYSVMPNQLVVYPRPDADFIADPGYELTVANGEIMLLNNSSPVSGNTYTWNVANIYSTSEVNTSTTFTAAGAYPVTLWVTNIYGCRDSVTKTITVKNEFGFYVPDAFTPFNDDGLNEEFKPVYSPYGLDLEGGYEMLIYDRWGHIIFKTNDITKGWDGTKSGQKLPQDVYVYKIRYRDALKNVHYKIGHVTLLH
ncbi:MAG: hypothetical protein KatS3mg027_2318 [Bacteroidia bacterium]|nr:MAG: hypothetical protein KatS3mg027_2318 [Bacteroidia bacterium]